MHFENRPTPLDVRAIDHDLAVEPSRAKQGGVKDVGPVGGGDQDHPGLDIEAVHLDEQLVEGLLTLVMAATETSTAVATDGIDLVDEDDRRGLRLGLLEQVAHRLAPTPTNISTKSEPEIEKNGTPASPATARAKRVLPVPGGP